jgi:hypothetical protein
MPTWLAVTIPTIVAVAACLMWALEYTKKAHEIGKLRLEVFRLEGEREAAKREESRRASGLYTPTTQEIDKYALERFLSHLGVSEEFMTNRVDDVDEPPFATYIRRILVLSVISYGVVRLVIDICRFIKKHT